MLSGRINVKCSFAHPRDNEIRLTGIGAVLFPFSLAAPRAINEASETKGSIGNGVVIYRDAPWKSVADTRLAARLSKMRFTAALSSRG